MYQDNSTFQPKSQSNGHKPTRCDTLICGIAGPCDYCLALSLRDTGLRNSELTPLERKNGDHIPAEAWDIACDNEGTLADHPESPECHPKESSPLPYFIEEAFAMSKEGKLPSVAKNYIVPEMKLLIGLCASLQALQDHRTFFLACRHAAEVLQIPFRKASRYLKRLESDGVIELVKRGNRRLANEYRFHGKIKQPKGDRT